MNPYDKWLLECSRPRPKDLVINRVRRWWWVKPIEEPPSPEELRRAVIIAAMTPDQLKNLLS